MDVTQAASSMLGMGGERPEHNRHQTFQSRMISLPGRNVVCSFSLSQLLCITRKILKWNITRLCLCVMSVLGSRTATGRLSALDYIDNRSTKIKPGLASAFGTVTPRYLCILSQTSLENGMGCSPHKTPVDIDCACPSNLYRPKKNPENALLKICCVRRSLP